jgi:hypothetical protein
VPVARRGEAAEENASAVAVTRNVPFTAAPAGRCATVENSIKQSTAIMTDRVATIRLILPRPVALAGREITCQHREIRLEPGREWLDPLREGLDPGLDGLEVE